MAREDWYVSEVGASIGDTINANLILPRREKVWDDIAMLVGPRIRSISPGELAL